MVGWTDMGHSHMRQTFLLGPEESTWNMGALSSEDPNSVVNMTEKHSLKRCGAEFQGKPREERCIVNDPSNQRILKLCTVSLKNRDTHREHHKLRISIHHRLPSTKRLEIESGDAWCQQHKHRPSQESTPILQHKD